MQRFHYQRLPLKLPCQERTPFYFYDIDLLRATLDEIVRCTAKEPFEVHYALKANGNKDIVKEIARRGLGADLVSGGEIKAAIEAGFDPKKMVFSGAGKTDEEIILGLKHDIGCFNVESIPELEVINQIASGMGCTARVAIRVNPDIDAHTHRYITTGTAEDKFGIGIEMLSHAITVTRRLKNLHLTGLHFHIGSQITLMKPFAMLCDTINSVLDHYEKRGIHFETINVGGGLGIDYDNPDTHPIPDFAQFFGTFKNHLNLREGQSLHFELGRSVMGQCGTLVTRVVFVKDNRNKKFVIVDGGMTDLIRPALYGAFHKIQNLTSSSTKLDTYDVVGPICESSDVFAHDCRLPVTRRGDIIVLRSAGAYGEAMASTYNMRPLPKSLLFSRKKK